MSNTEMQNPRILKALTEPSLVFSKPEDIVFCDYLNTEQKIISLENWKSTLTHLSDSTYEGMSSSVHEEMILGKVLEALNELKYH